LITTQKLTCITADAFPQINPDKRDADKLKR